MVVRKEEKLHEVLLACAPGLSPAAAAELEALSGHDEAVCRRVLALTADALGLDKEHEEAFLRTLTTHLSERMFHPENRPAKALSRAEKRYLRILEAVLPRNLEGFDPLTDLVAVPEESVAQSRVREEYGVFTAAVKESHFVALMRISREIEPFDPASHTIGVHNVALHTAILTAQAGIKVDLPLVSAASLGHDIGKFGCRGEEARRIPYFHYYYTWQWFSENGMEDIGHVSANHSTWDLEFENLPIESLFLIYADFRVRGTRDSSGREQVVIYSLADAYNMIFSKLADMTQEKVRRYKTVYHKLRDFERLLVSHGVPTDLSVDTVAEVEVRGESLLDAAEALDALQCMAISGSTELMRTVSIDKSFERLLGQAKGEKNLHSIRTYLQLLEEYSTYMTKANKKKTLQLLYELLMHPEGDVRRIAGRIMGQILANSGPKYRKERPGGAHDHAMTPTMMALLDESVELWQQYMDMCLYPDRRISAAHVLRISNSLKTITKSLFANCDEKEAPALLAPLLENLYNAEGFNRFVLVDAFCRVPQRYLPEDCTRIIEKLTEMLYSDGPVHLHIIVIWAMSQLAQIPRLTDIIHQVVDKFDPGEGEFSYVMAYRKAHILGRPLPEADSTVISRLYLSNLKSAVHWEVKLSQIDILMTAVERRPELAFHAAMHLSNLLSVSEHLPVREYAGKRLLELAKNLTVEQLNEITFDLLRELEAGRDQISRFIPPYIGRLMCLLPEKELWETIDFLEGMLRGASERPAMMALYTLGEALNVMAEENEAVCDKVLGLLMVGVSHYSSLIHQTALTVLCRDVFGADTMSDEKKSEYLLRIHKKLLTILSEPREGQLNFFNRAAMMNHLYRCITHLEVTRGAFHFPAQKPVAFFPGTFDPFSVGHKQIVQSLREMGLEVYLATDEFSWSKKTLPKMLRRQIVGISVADEWDTYLFPDDIPINIAMPEDLAQLASLFPGRELYLVAGSDVLRDASAYRSGQSGSAVDYNHVVIFRDGSADEAEIRQLIRGKVKILSLPPFYETVSSSRIREYVDRKLDISMLVDPVVQSFIYQNGLYVRQPEMKNVLSLQEMYFRHFTKDDPCPDETICALMERWSKPWAVALYNRPDTLVGYAVGHTVHMDSLYETLGSIEAASYVRQHTSGRILMVDEVIAEKPAMDRAEVLRTLINELLVRSLYYDHTYAAFRIWKGDELFREVILQMGFILVEGTEDIYYVDMRRPVMLLQDLLLSIKPPYRDMPAVREIVAKTRPRLRTAFTRMFPGKLILAFDSELLNQALMERVQRLNGVTEETLAEKKLGPYMCVPYGKILSDAIVPGTITKALHADKCFMPDVRDFEVVESRGYSPLRNQVRTLKSFHRPVILVDDLMHKGYRVEKMDEVFRAENLDTERIIVAIMSGSGQDLMEVQHRAVESEYFIPNLRYWAYESLLYPFIGGDSVKKDSGSESWRASLNLILPYYFPNHFYDVPDSAIQLLSQVALENARDILRVLEDVHQKNTSTVLTLRDLGEVLTQPHLPDRGSHLRYDFDLTASGYVEEDLNQLIRICRREGGVHEF